MKIKPDPTKPLHRAQSRLYEEDYTYVCKTLGGGVCSLQNEILRELFSKFTSYVKTLNLKENDPRNLDRIRTAVKHATVIELVRPEDGYRDAHG